jgi:acetyl-CoA acetyltransferase
MKSRRFQQWISLRKQAYAQAGLTPDDIDAAIIYDAFTAIVMWQLESWGFAAQGKSKDFITVRRIAPGWPLAHQHARRSVE